VDDGAGADGGCDGGVGWVREIDRKGLVGLIEGVALDLDSDRLVGLTGVESQAAAGPRVVSRRGGGDIGRGVINAHSPSTWGRQADREVGMSVATVAFGHSRVVN